MESPMFFVPPRRTHKTSVFILNMFWTNLQHFYLFIFFSPKPQRRGPLEVLFDIVMGQVYPKFGFSEVPRNDNGLNKFIWKNNHQIQQKNLGKSLVLFRFSPFLEIPETSLFWQWNWTWYSPLNFKRQMYKKRFLKCRLLFKRK